MNPHDLLKAAKAKIEDPKNWIKRYMARNADGAAVNPKSSSAVCWCSMGAVYSIGVVDYANPRDPYLRARYALNEAAATLVSRHNYSAMDFNDHSSHADVMRMFDLAISRTADPEYLPHIF